MRATIAANVHRSHLQRRYLIGKKTCNIRNLLCIRSPTCSETMSRPKIWIEGGNRDRSKLFSFNAQSPENGDDHLREYDPTAQQKQHHLVVIGGGAAGFMGAIEAANVIADNSKLKVSILEATSNPLNKVKISGGGRCNVMQDATKSARLITEGYPRGRKPLIGLLESFGPSQTYQWFDNHGVQLKTEPDGRMFPITDKSQTIIDCLRQLADTHSIAVETRTRVEDIRVVQEEKEGGAGMLDDDDHFFEITCKVPKMDGVVNDNNKLRRAASDIRKIRCDYVLLATGSYRPAYQWAKRLGHAIEPPVPSLFTFETKDDHESTRNREINSNAVVSASSSSSSSSSQSFSASSFKSLAGISVEDVDLKLRVMEKEENDEEEEEEEEPPPRELSNLSTSKILSSHAQKNRHRKQQQYRRRKEYKLSDRGPVLFTHSGLSGPAILRLSAFGARYLHDSKYKGTLIINWLASIGVSNQEEAKKTLEKVKGEQRGKKLIGTYCPLGSTTTSSSSSILPKRLWGLLLDQAAIPKSKQWSEISKKEMQRLSQILTSHTIKVTGKGTFKDEFVTCGGISLKNVNTKTLQSKIVSRLFFAGEILDIDGITGGYNFQSAWSTGWHAGNTIGTLAAASFSNLSDTEKKENS